MYKRLGHVDMLDDAPSYVRLFHLLSAIRDIATFSDMSADEERLLGELIVRWHGARAVTVSAVMHDPARASSSAIYRRLISLREKGLVAMRVDDGDKRVKLVEPTAKAKAYMRELGQSLDISFRSESRA